MVYLSIFHYFDVLRSWPPRPTWRIFTHVSRIPSSSFYASSHKRKMAGTQRGALSSSPQHQQQFIWWNTNRTLGSQNIIRWTSAISCELLPGRISSPLTCLSSQVHTHRWALLHILQVKTPIRSLYNNDQNIHPMCVNLTEKKKEYNNNQICVQYVRT